VAPLRGLLSECILLAVLDHSLPTTPGCTIIQSQKPNTEPRSYYTNNHGKFTVKLNILLFCALHNSAVNNFLDLYQADIRARQYLLQKTSSVLTLTCHNSSGHRVPWIHITGFGTCTRKLQCAIYIYSLNMPILFI